MEEAVHGSALGVLGPLAHQAPEFADPAAWALSAALVRDRWNKAVPCWGRWREFASSPATDWVVRARAGRGGLHASYTITRDRRRRSIRVTQ